MTKGNIFNIQKFSIHDGPGIRTTVFFKGCPLRCKWCSNPESQEFETQITYDKRKCIGCKSCINTCPKNCISWIEESDDKGHIKINEKECIKCKACVDHCSSHALSSEGELKELQDVLDICLQDIDFYEESKGGVTLSGGECFCQSEFVTELIHKLKEHNIHVAAETTGYIDEETFQKIAPLFDLILFDVKHYDSNCHKDGTGVDIEFIQKNLMWAFQNGINILPRIPVIPGFNDNLSDANGIATLLKSIGFKRAQLLPFHQFGEHKYDLLGREYEMKKVKALFPEDLESYKQIFIEQGIECFI